MELPSQVGVTEVPSQGERSTLAGVGQGWSKATIWKTVYVTDPVPLFIRWV